MKKNKQALGKLIVVSVLILAIIGLVRHFHIKNFHVIAPELLYTSGQPRGMDYTRLLYKYHIATIVNLRSAAEHRERNWYNEEITWVRNNGVNYLELPIPKGEDYLPDKEIQKRFLEIMADKDNLPVLLHDSSGRKRVAMLAAVWLITADGKTSQQVFEIAGELKQKPLTDDEKQFIKTIADNPPETAG